MYKHIAKTKKELLFVYIQTYGPVSCETLEKQTGWKHQTVSARLTELHDARRIKIAGTTTNADGYTARLYRAAR